MKENEKTNVIDITAEKMEILKRVNDVGCLGNVDSWKKAYPNIIFPENVYSAIVDEAVYGKGSERHEVIKVNWEERTVAERVFYVMFQEYFADLEIRFDVVVGDELQITRTVDNPEVIWDMWIDGCFSGEELKEEALRDFVGLMTDCNPKKGEYVDDADINDIKVVNLELKIRQL